jgi:hypothetical protein
MGPAALVRRCQCAPLSSCDLVCCSAGAAQSIQTHCPSYSGRPRGRPLYTQSLGSCSARWEEKRLLAFDELSGGARQAAKAAPSATVCRLWGPAPWRRLMFVRSQNSPAKLERAQRHSSNTHTTFAWTGQVVGKRQKGQEHLTAERAKKIDPQSPTVGPPQRGRGPHGPRLATQPGPSEGATRVGRHTGKACNILPTHLDLNLRCY